jgi:hypothetical protein
MGRTDIYGEEISRSELFQIARREMIRASDQKLTHNRISTVQLQYLTPVLEEIIRKRFVKSALTIHLSS